MKIWVAYCLGAFAALPFAAFGAAASQSGDPASAVFAPPATPPGVTIQLKASTTRSANGSGSYKSGTGVHYFADDNAMPLYVYDPDATDGRSTCTGACAEAWPPFVAPDSAKVVGDWTTSVRTDGTRQWRHKGRPLYRSVNDRMPGEPETPRDNGWRLADFNPAVEGILPAGVGITARIATVNGPAFTDSRGMTLYVYDADTTRGELACVGECLDDWKPLRAAALVKPHGDWSIVARPDGIRQWALRGKPLYTSVRDFKVGDANGEFDTHWHVALLNSYFMPAEAAIGRIPKGWVVLTKADGRTLYARDEYRFSYGGYTINDGPPPSADVGRKIGTAGCAGDCVQEWLPLEAPTEAVSTGYWSVVTRDDGTRQWAYDGYPLYSNIRDERPGDTRGSDLFTFSDGSNALYWRIATP